jgi:hypothetical protein
MPIVEAVGIATAVHKNPVLARKIAAAMRQAILDCNAEGISTSDENSAVIRERMMAARQRVIDEVKAAEAEVAVAMEKLRKAQQG